MCSSLSRPPNHTFRLSTHSLVQNILDHLPSLCVSWTLTALWFSRNQRICLLLQGSGPVALAKRDGKATLGKGEKRGPLTSQGLTPVFMMETL